VRIALVRHPHWAHLAIGTPGRPPGVIRKAFVQRLTGFLDRLAGAPDLRCVVLEVASCQGAAVGEIAAASGHTVLRQAERFAALLQRLHDFPVPVICWVRGALQGGAVGLAAACDVVLGDRESSFCLPEAAVGMAPILIGPWMTRRIGAAAFRYLALTSATIEAERALQLGLLDDYFGGPGFPPSCARILRSSPASLREIKRLTAFAPFQETVPGFAEFTSRPDVRSDLALLLDGKSPPWRKKKAHGSGS
jgi:methylglutaconyl-CoA hydratase